MSHPVPALSFEFTTIQRSVATACLGRLEALGNYRFNIALGESQSMTFDGAVTIATCGLICKASRTRPTPETSMLSFRADRSTPHLAASRRCAAAAFALLVMALGPQPVWAGTGAPLGVTVENASEPVLCAEADNVTLKFTSPKVRKFRIVGTHPAYFGSLREDNWDADWTACDFGPEPPKPAAPAAGKPEPVKQIQRVTLYEDPEQWIVGWRYPAFLAVEWRRVQGW